MNLYVLFAGIHSFIFLREINLARKFHSVRVTVDKRSWRTQVGLHGRIFKEFHKRHNQGRSCARRVGHASGPLGRIHVPQHYHLVLDRCMLGAVDIEPKQIHFKLTTLIG